MALPARPSHTAYDVVIVGGGIMGAAVGFFLARDPAFRGRVLVVERDPSYERAATSLTNSCIRQQFGTEVNVRISQFTARFLKDFRDWMGDAEAPESLPIQSFGYLYLAGTEARAAELRRAQALQARLGAATEVLSPEEIAARWPFYDLDGVVLGTHNPVDEGYFDGGTVFDWFRRRGRALGVEYIHGEVTGLEMSGERIGHVVLGSGERLAVGHLVNAAGTRAPAIAAMAGCALPIEPRRRFTYVFEAAEPLPVDLPLTIDPSGVHMRTEGRLYMAGCPPLEDPAVDVDDFDDHPEIWEERVWPALAARVPAFERIRLRHSWVGQYDFNLMDQNALLGPHPDCTNLICANGFSGHGLQQAPAVGRGLAELIVHGGYRELDLGDLSADRLRTGKPLLESAII